MPGYTKFTANRKQRVGGGVAIYIKSTMNGRVLETYTSPSVSALWLLVRHPDMAKTIVGCIYHPPSSDEKTTLTYMEDTLCKLSVNYTNSKILLVGDFNSTRIILF